MAVVANWNGGEEALECVGSILDQGLREEEIVFVDNGSRDGSVEAVLARWPRLGRVLNRENLGFCEASNQGTAAALAAGAECVLFVNNDVELPPGSLQAMLAVLAQEPRVGVLGPRVLYKGRRNLIWSAGGMLTWRQNLSTLIGHARRDGPEWQVRREVDYVPGCTMLVRREVFEQVGLFDASFFAYMEDIDFCVRAREAGWRVLVAGEIAAYHTTSASTGGGYSPRRKYMMGVNSVWMLKRHGGPTEWLRFWAFDVLSLPFLWLWSIPRGEARAVLGKALGILHGLRGRRVTARAIAPGGSWLW
jgi:GT2 family glycosyltransferase